MISPKHLGKSLVILVLLSIPTLLIFAVGAGIVWTAYYGYTFVALFLLLALTFAVLIARIIQSSLGREPLVKGLHEDARLIWMKLHNLFVAFVVADFLVFLTIVLIGTGYSSIPQPTAIEIAMFFLSISLLLSAVIRQFVMGVIGQEYDDGINNPGQQAWIYAGLALPFLKTKKEYGILYLKKCLIATKTVCEVAGRIPEKLDDVISYVETLWIARINANHDGLVKFVLRISDEDRVKLEEIPDASDELLGQIAWFQKFRSKSANSADGHNGTRSARVDTYVRVIGALSAIISTVLITFYNSLAPSLPAIESNLASQEGAFAILALSLLALYLPTILLRDLWITKVPYHAISAYSRSLTLNQGPDQTKSVHDSPGQSSV